MRLTIALAKKSRSPGWRRHLHQLGPGAELRRRGGNLVFLGAVEPLLLFLLLVLGRLLRIGLVDPPAGQEHHPGLSFHVLGCLEPDRAVAVLAQEAGVPVAVDERAAEERLHPVKVVLLPVTDQRVVVALGATDVDPEEGRADVGGEPIEVLDPLPEVFGGHLLDLVRLVGQHQLAEDPVPGAVLAGGLDQVVAQAPLAAGHQHRIELRRLVTNEAGRGHQAVDQPGPLIGVGRPDEGAGLGGRGNPPGQVERQPADQGCIVGRGRGLDRFLAEGPVNVMIDDLPDRAIGREQVSGPRRCTR